jgi:hypothetical protein
VNGISHARTVCGAIAAIAASAALAAGDPAFVPSERILPDTTRVWVSIRQPDAVRASFNKTQLGKMLQDPAMQPFVKSFREQLRNSGRQRLKKLGLTLEDLEKIPSGELAIACVEPRKDVAAVVLLVDATGNERDLAALIEQMTDRIGKQGGRRLPPAAATPELVAFQLPPDPADRSGKPEFAAFASKGSALVIGDDVSVVADAFTRLSKGRPDSVESLPAFRPVMERTAKGLPAGRTPVRWYVDPLKYAGLMETLRNERERALPRTGSKNRSGEEQRDRRVDVLLRNGFDCILGAGGHVVFDAGSNEVLHHSLVYAPPLPGREPFGTNRFNSSARMLRFPNTTSIDPPEWVPRDIARWTAFEWDMKTAFKSAEPIVDDMVGEPGAFDDIIVTLREDPDGPQIEVERDLIEALGTRVVVVSDHVHPIDAEADRLLVAIEAKDAKLLAATINKSMQSEPDMRRVEHGGHVIWELVEKDITIPKLEVETSAGKIAHEDSHQDDAEEGRRSRRERLREREERLLPHSAVTVAHGHLFIASHIDFLQKVIDTSGGPEALAASADYKAVTAETLKLFPSKTALRSFGRAEETARPTYEAIKNGWMPSSKSLLGQMLNNMLSDGKPGSVRTQRIDGSTLPEFDVVRKYFGTSGLSVESTEDGWFVGGTTFARSGNAEPEVARRAAAASR